MEFLYIKLSSLGETGEYEDEHAMALDGTLTYDMFKYLIDQAVKSETGLNVRIRLSSLYDTTSMRLSDILREYVDTSLEVVDMVDTIRSCTVARKIICKSQIDIDREGTNINEIADVCHMDYVKRRLAEYGELIEHKDDRDEYADFCNNV